MSASYVYRVVPNALIYNRLFAWKGSFAVVPEDIGEQHVSNEFPQFFCKSNLVLPEYLFLVCMTDSFNALVNQASTGSAAVSRNRLRESKFLNFEIVLPPLETQHAIVRRWQEGQAEAGRLEANLKTSEKSTSRIVLSALGIENTLEPKTRPKAFALMWADVERWSLDYIFRIMQTELQGKHNIPKKNLSELCEGRSGSTPAKNNHTYWNGDIPWVSPKDMKAFELHDAQDHVSQSAVDAGKATLLPENSVLFVVRSGILQRTVPIAINRVPVSINQDIRAYSLKTDEVTIDFLAVYLQAQVPNLLALVKSGVTVQSINKEELDSFLIPLPPLETQREIVRQVQAVRSEAARLRAEAAKLRRDTKEAVERLILGSENVFGLV